MENELKKDYIEELEKIHHQKRKISLDFFFFYRQKFNFLSVIVALI